MGLPWRQVSMNLQTDGLAVEAGINEFADAGISIADASE
jgi:hypothetical protein